MRRDRSVIQQSAFLCASVRVCFGASIPCSLLVPLQNPSEFEQEVETTLAAAREEVCPLCISTAVS